MERLLEVYVGKGTWDSRRSALNGDQPVGEGERTCMVVEQVQGRMGPRSTVNIWRRSVCEGKCVSMRR
jgi:hypothetical protein